MAGSDGLGAGIASATAVGAATTGIFCGGTLAGASIIGGSFGRNPMIVGSSSMSNSSGSSISSSSVGALLGTGIALNPPRDVGSPP